VFFSSLRFLFCPFARGKAGKFSEKRVLFAAESFIYFKEPPGSNVHVEKAIGASKKILK
jgi:hypothetical protein